MRKSYPIERVQQDEPVLYIPKELGFKNCSTVVFGSVSRQVKIQLQETNKERITISLPLAKALHLPDIPLKLHIFKKGNTLFLGPIVGIFTAGFTTFPHTPIGGRSYVFAKLLSLYEKAGVLPIIFGVQHINWEEGLVNGYFNYRGEWQQIVVPLPNVIYDRLPNRKVENLKMIQEFKTRLADEYLIPWYNPGFFSKTDIYEKISQNNETKSYIPEYMIFKEDALEKMLSKYGFIYLKPNHGSLGNGVFQVRKTKNNHYLCRYRDEQENNRLFRFTSFSSLAKFLQDHCKMEELIIQQGINLLKSDHHFADFRVHTNKDLDGRWHVTAIGCKVAGQGSATTHLLSGGSIQTLEEFFPDKEKRDPILKDLIDSSILLSKQIEKQYDYLLAEIGFDIGMDTEGHIWMFEANSKPGRAIFKHPKLRKFERFTQMYALTYAIYLTEKVITEPEKFFHDAVLQ